ncbi:type II toxin-antitoxin system VapC family toxin [Candidatus Woesearchaeota archaeon]|nr:type II toxin-antitoxin system VapC family toxin [Candidatus Woesearchaeota archaeon]
MCHFCKYKTLVTHPIDVASAELIIEDIATTSRFTVFDVKPKNVLDAIRIKKSSKAVYWDCIIAAVMKENNITTTYTEDREFEKIDGIKTVNPFTQPT